ncbi:hypothetical protein DPMN_113798 [Dreissena polymorpha]|uniref:Uncharacterized protein n=1 Tax=Dreissena polymorpha TaxID=45954 RepID=A0A9D4KIN5_DREPO|nr:hypothetical protein DPMN_113798 [Dreissena polymorpha]
MARGECSQKKDNALMKGGCFDWHQDVDTIMELYDKTRLCMYLYVMNGRTRRSPPEVAASNRTLRHRRNVPQRPSILPSVSPAQPEDTITNFRQTTIGKTNQRQNRDRDKGNVRIPLPRAHKRPKE